MVLVIALLLNIALIIFGWRRYRDLTREIAERRSTEVRMHLLAATDPLTQCLNRRSMFEATEELRGRAAICGEVTAYSLIDRENFKQINDIHGHATGDAVLVMLWERVRALLPREARLARLGGDEFAFLIPYPAGHDDRVDDLVIRLPDISVELTLSIGLAADRDADSMIGLVVQRARGCTARTWCCIKPRSRAGTAISGSSRAWKANCGSANSSKPGSAGASRGANSCRSTNSRSISISNTGRW